MPKNKSFTKLYMMVAGACSAPSVVCVAVVLLRCVILMLIKDFPHKSGCAKGDLIAAPSLSLFCAVKHTNRQALLSVRLSLLPLLSGICRKERTYTLYIIIQCK